MSERRTWRPSSATCGHGGRHELAFPLSDQEQRDDPAADPCRRHRPVCAYGPVRASRQLHRGRAVRGHGAHLLRRENAARDFADPAGDLPAVHGHPTVHHGSQPRTDGVAGRGHLPRRGGKLHDPLRHFLGRRPAWFLRISGRCRGTRVRPHLAGRGPQEEPRGNGAEGCLVYGWGLDRLARHA